MKEKVLLILSDGPRPDAMTACGHPFVSTFLKKSSYTLKGTSVFPPVTLPAHMSIFHSVTPERHGTMTNTYVPQVRPVSGLCEQLFLAGKKCAFFYSWEELRDLSRPSSLAYSFFYSGPINTYKKANDVITEASVRYISEEKPDFAFIYLGLTDDTGHNKGWLSNEYMDDCRLTFNKAEEIISRFSEEYTIIFTADHGGHQRTHGMDIPEDMLIPVVFMGKAFKPGTILPPVNLCDIAPTIVKLMGAAPCSAWEGKSLL